jgi:adenylate cyclase
MAETRKLAAILVSDVVGYSRLASADEDHILAQLRTLRSDLIDPTIAVHHGRIVKRTGDGAIVEFRSVVDAVRCAIEIQNAMVQRNVGIAEDRRIVFRIGIHVGDVVEESDGDLMGDGVNIAARLEGVAEPGAICLSEDAYRHVKSRLELAVTDLGPMKLKNIAEPIRTYSLQVGASAAPKAAAPAPTPGTEKPSIAVLPFQNMSGEPDQEYFVDGLVEDVITGLSRIKSLVVIARNSSFVYKGKAVDIRQVGRELGVRYVLEGSVRKGGNKLRITTQLIEAETGAHLWADRLEGDFSDVFALQDQVTERVVGVIEPSVRNSEIERSRRKPPDSLAAYDFYLRALWHLKFPTTSEARIAAPLLQEALRLDPDYPAAHAELAHCHEMFFFYGGGFDPADQSAGLKHAEAVIASGTDDANALATAGFVIWQLGQDYERARAAIELALSYNSCCTNALLWGALVYGLGGESAKAAALAERAVQLSPLDPLMWQAHFCLGHAALLDERNNDAISHYAKATQFNPQLGLLHSAYAVALALAGCVEEAELAGRKALELEPTLRYGPLMQMVRSPVLRDKMLTGARLAGLPE